MRKFLGACLFVVMMAVFLLVQEANAAQDRLAIFVSDFHVGSGKDPVGKWLKIEDFRWEAEFSKFLGYIASQGNDKVDLIIVGDLLELWQSDHMDDCRNDNKEWGCTEKQALERTKRIITGHKGLFDSLRSFAGKGSNRIVVLPGNHDAALLFPQVMKEVADAISPNFVWSDDCTTGGKICFGKNGYWMSSDRRIYADHGHQFDIANKFKNWPLPFKGNNNAFLESPVGERMAQQFFNKYEERFPVIDNYLSEAEGIKYGISQAGKGATIQISGDFASFLLRKLSLKQSFSILGGGNESATDWDLVQLRALPDPNIFLESVDPKDNPEYYEAVKQGIAIGAITDADVQSLSDQELTAICNYKAELHQQGKTVAECPKANLGALAAKLLKLEDHYLTSYLTTTYKELKKKYPGIKVFPVYIYGHTHEAREGRKLAISELSWNPMVYNSGAFQRVTNEVDMNKIQRTKKVKGTVEPEDLSPCYTFIQIQPYSEKAKPKVELLKWVTSGNNNEWKAESGVCP